MHQKNKNIYIDKQVASYRYSTALALFLTSIQPHFVCEFLCTKLLQDYIYSVFKQKKDPAADFVFCISNTILFTCDEDSSI